MKQVGRIEVPAGGVPGGARARRLRRAVVTRAVYAVGREKVREYAYAMGETDPRHLDPEAARAAGLRRRRRAADVRRRLLRRRRSGPAILDPEVGIDFARMVHGAQEFTWDTLRSSRATRSPPWPSSTSTPSAAALQLLRLPDALDQPGRRERVLRGAMDEHRSTDGHARPLPDRTATRARRATSTRSTSTTSSRGRSACPGRSCTGCGRWPRSPARRPRPAGGPESLQRARGAVPRHGPARARRSRSRSTVREERDGELVITLRRRAGRQADHPQRRGRGPARRPLIDLRPQGRLIEIDGVLTPRQELLLRKVVDGFADHRAARRLEGARRRSRRDRRPVDRPQRARGARGARPARAPAHVGRPRADRRGLPLLRRPSCCPRAAPCRTGELRLELVRREVDEAMRVTDRDAVAGHRPAGDRLRAADPDDDDPPRRGAARCSRRC